MLSDAEMRERMEKGWRGGLPHTLCGNGSSLANTANIRRWLPEIVQQYDFRLINDAGAGDQFWISRMEWQAPVRVKYYDLFPRTAEVKHIDITKRAMTKCDAILCRMVLNHLVGEPGHYERVDMALEQFRKSSPYLFATEFEGAVTNRTPQFQRLHLSDWLGSPLEKIQDGSEANCFLALWAL